MTISAKVRKNKDVKRKKKKKTVGVELEYVITEVMSFESGRLLSDDPILAKINKINEKQE